MVQVVVLQVTPGKRRWYSLQYCTKHVLELALRVDGKETEHLFPDFMSTLVRVVLKDLTAPCGYEGWFPMVLRKLAAQKYKLFIETLGMVFITSILLLFFFSFLSSN